MNIACPCGSGLTFEKCCSPYIKGAKNAPTAEALMRARYSAYATHDIDFIINTCTDDAENKVDPDETRKWSEESEWLGLKIVKTVQGGPDDSEGLVEFVASYKQDGKREDHHERSAFVKKAGRWLFDQGALVVDTVVRESPKIGRNDPCPCGSGKKYKQCCALKGK